MNVLDRLWERVSGSQPLPPAWVIGATALAALIIVTGNGSWRVAGKVITIAHEGGHALVSVLSGRRLEGIRLHADSSGVTYSRGKRHGPGLVATAAAGYLAPSLLGAGAAALLAAGHETAMLWLALVLLAATFLAVRNAFGALAVLVTAGGVFAISYLRLRRGAGRLRLPGRVVPAVRRDAPGARADPPPPLPPRGHRRRPARPADRRVQRPVDGPVPAGLGRGPGRRRRLRACLVPRAARPPGDLAYFAVNSHQFRYTR